MRSRLISQSLESRTLLSVVRQPPSRSGVQDDDNLSDGGMNRPAGARWHSDIPCRAMCGQRLASCRGRGYVSQQAASSSGRQAGSVLHQCQGSRLSSAYLKVASASQSQQAVSRQARRHGEVSTRQRRMLGVLRGLPHSKGADDRCLGISPVYRIYGRRL